MATDTASSNPLITTKPSEAALSVQLHPLVLLTITDYITRHISRQQKEPVVGAIIGQQNGRNFTLEHAYECKTLRQPDGSVAVDAAWFVDRIEQYKDVHKAPALDLVAMFMLGSSVEGPVPVHAQLVKQVQELTTSDPSMLLLFHAELVDQLQGGKLPISLYESVQEQEGAGVEVEIKFRELNFEVETGEAEMIGVDFVATGAGNAMAVAKAEGGKDGVSTSTSTGVVGESSSSKEKEKKTTTTKGKGKAKDKGAGDEAEAETNGTTSHSHLSAEDEELIASLTAKANAIKMLNQRINLIRNYLKTLPPSYLTDSTSTETSSAETNTNHTLLRSINAMLSRLPLLSPPTTNNPATDSTQPTSTSASSKEQSAVHLTSLLASLTRSISEAQTLGSKFHIVAREKQAKDRSSVPGGGGGGGRIGNRGGLGFGDERDLLSATGDNNGGF